MLHDFFVETRIVNTYVLPREIGKNDKLVNMSFVILLHGGYVWLYNPDILIKQKNRKKRVKRVIRKYKRESCTVEIKPGSVYMKAWSVMFLRFSEIKDIIGGDNSKEIWVLKEIKKEYENKKINFE